MSLTYDPNHSCGVRTIHKELTAPSRFPFDHVNIRDLGREEREERRIRSHLLMIQTNSVGVRTIHKQLTGEDSRSYSVIRLP